MQITAFKAILARIINIQGCEDYEISTYNQTPFVRKYFHNLRTLLSGFDTVHESLSTNKKWATSILQVRTPPQARWAQRSYGDFLKRLHLSVSEPITQ